MTSRRLLALAIAGAVIAGSGAVVACGSGRDADRGIVGRQRSEPPRDEAGAPPRRIFVGAWSVPVDGARTWQAREASFRALETALGRRLDIEHIYARFRPSPIDDRIARAYANARLPLVSWNDPDPASVNDGSSDAYVRGVARQFAAQPGRVLLRFGWEMDRPTNRWRDPAAFVAMWRRLHRLFEEEGASAVEWVWCPTDWSFAPQSGRDPLSWYPGDDAVDWLCADGYSFYPEKPVWVPFEQGFGAFYDWARRRGKPIMIGETGVMEDPERPDRKAQWYRELAETVRCRFTEVDAVVLFDEEKHERGLVRDWRVASTPESAAGARRAFADPMLGGEGPSERCPNSFG